MINTNLKVGDPVKLLLIGRYTGQTKTEKAFVQKVNLKTIVIEDKKFLKDSGQHQSKEKDCIFYLIKDWTIEDENKHIQMLLQNKFNKVLSKISSFNGNLSSEFVEKLETLSTELETLPKELN